MISPQLHLEFVLDDLKKTSDCNFTWNLNCDVTQDQKSWDALFNINFKNKNKKNKSFTNELCLLTKGLRSVSKAI